MKITKNRITENKHSITSYRIVIGCRRAKMLGMLKEDGTTREYVPISSNGNITLIPIDETVGTLRYGRYTTTICKHDKFFFGEIPQIAGCPSWFTTNEANAEQAFRKVADTYTL